MTSNRERDEKELAPAEREAIRKFLWSLFVIPTVLVSVITGGAGYFVSQMIQDAEREAVQKGEREGEERAKQGAEQELSFLRNLLADSVVKATDAAGQATGQAERAMIVANNVSKQLENERMKATEIQQELEERRKEVMEITETMKEKIKGHLPALARILASDGAFSEQVKQTVADQVLKNEEGIGKLREEAAALNIQLDVFKSDLSAIQSQFQNKLYCETKIVWQLGIRDHEPENFFEGNLGVSILDIEDDGDLRDLQINNETWQEEVQAGFQANIPNTPYFLQVRQVYPGPGQEDSALISVCQRLELQSDNSEN